MKKLTYILIISLFFVGVFHAQSLYSKIIHDAGNPLMATTSPHPLKNGPKYYNIGILNHTIFPLSGYLDEAVCRKPPEKDAADPLIMYPYSQVYRYNGYMLGHSYSISPQYMKVEGNSIYEKGNTTLLIPHEHLISSKKGQLNTYRVEIIE